MSLVQRGHWVMKLINKNEGSQKISENNGINVFHISILGIITDKYNASTT